MTKLGLMVDRCINQTSVPVLVDLGYVKDAGTKRLARRLMEYGVGRKNFSVEGFGRLLVKLPRATAAKTLDRFKRSIVAGACYWQTTHHRKGLSQ